MSNRKTISIATLLAVCAIEYWLSRLDLAIAVLLIGVACVAGSRKTAR